MARAVNGTMHGGPHRHRVPTWGIAAGVAIASVLLVLLVITLIGAIVGPDPH